MKSEIEKQTDDIEELLKLHRKLRRIEKRLLTIEKDIEKSESSTMSRFLNTE